MFKPSQLSIVISALLAGAAFTTTATAMSVAQPSVAHNAAASPLDTDTVQLARRGADDKGADDRGGRGRRGRG